MGRTTREAVEIVHLAFLEQLGMRLGKDRFVIKGGCNLRFFFKSVRYSEDLDLDVDKVARGTLKKAVEQVLGGQGLRHTSSAAGIVISRFSAPKQTETTQRWKLGLEIEGTPAHTKIEFSRRGLSGATEFGPADPVLTARHGLAPLLATHYTRKAAIQQKVNALIGRAEPQARDVFDLNLLLAGGAHSVPLTPAQRDKVSERALALGFDAFRSQVVAYLEPGLQEQYGSPDIWDQIVLTVIEGLGGRLEAD